MATWCPICGYGQTVDGAYAGRLISEGNVLVISVKGSYVNGSIYLGAYKKVPFVGTISEMFLKGVAVSDNNSQIIVTGRMYKDSLVAQVFSNLDTAYTTLLRIGPLRDFSPTKYFVGEVHALDPQLVGRWRMVKQMNPRGTEERPLRFQTEYLETGMVLPDKSYLKDFLDDFNFKNRSNLKFDLEKLPPIEWKTSGHTLIISSDRNETILEYEIRSDTLITTTRTGYKSFYLRITQKP